MSQTDQNASRQNCPICGSANNENLYPDGAVDPITGNRFHIRSCKSCHLAFTSPQPTNMEIYYPSKYRGYGPLVSSILQFFYRSRVAQWNRMFKTPGKALEIGCGPGFMLNVLKRKGWNVKGLERTEAVAAYARDRLGLDVTPDDVSDLPEISDFDLIILFNVLEHLKNPLSVLEESAKRLAPGGKLVISVPNFQSLQARLAGPVWLHLDPPRHLFHFTPESLELLLSKVGLRTQSVSYVSFEHDPYGLIESAINKITGTHNTLTLFLMGLRSFDAQVLISLILAGILAVPAFILATFGWLSSDGALFQAVAVEKSRN